MLGRKKGFTLIELLVVIAIIAILAAILFPVFARAREKARTTTCQSNLKQLATALHMYAQDYDEKFCPNYIVKSPGIIAHWYETVQPYVKNAQLVVCPSSPYAGGIQAGVNPLDWNYIIGHYAGNNWVMTGSWGAVENSMASVTHPSETIFIYDAAYGWRWCGYPAANWWGAPNAQCYDIPAVDLTQYGYGSFERHNGGINIAFVDGHVKWMKANKVGLGEAAGYGSTLYTAYWQKTR